jgi:hypothetical protein
MVFLLRDCGLRLIDCVRTLNSCFSAFYVYTDCRYADVSLLKFMVPAGTLLSVTDTSKDFFQLALTLTFIYSYLGPKIIFMKLVDHNNKKKILLPRTGITVPEN